MGAPRKYPEELKERATRLVVATRRDRGSKAGAIKRIVDYIDDHKTGLPPLQLTRGVERFTLRVRPD